MCSRDETCMQLFLISSCVLQICSHLKHAQQTDVFQTDLSSQEEHFVKQAGSPNKACNDLTTVNEDWKDFELDEHVHIPELLCRTCLQVGAHLSRSATAASKGRTTMSCLLWNQRYLMPEPWHCMGSHLCRCSRLQGTLTSPFGSRAIVV